MAPMRTRTTRSSGRVLPCSDRALNRCISDTSSPIGVGACHHSNHRLEWRHRVNPPQALEPTSLPSKGCAAHSAPRFPEFIARLPTPHLPFGHAEPLLCVTP